MMISCLYNLPSGRVQTLCDFLQSFYSNTQREIWLLGDFNVDFLDRKNESRTKFINTFKQFVLLQLIQALTRPNNGGSCSVWIVTNSDFVNKSGVLNVYISDHFPVFLY